MNYRINFKLSVFDQFKIESYIHVDFYIILNSFKGWVKLDLVLKSDKYRVIESVLNTSSPYDDFGLFESLSVISLILPSFQQMNKLFQPANSPNTNNNWFDHSTLYLYQNKLKLLNKLICQTPTMILK